MERKGIFRRRFLKEMGAGALAAPVLSNVVGGRSSYGESVDRGAFGFPMIQSGASRKRNVLFISTDVQRAVLFFDIAHLR